MLLLSVMLLMVLKADGGISGFKQLQLQCCHRDGDEGHLGLDS